MSVSTNGLCPAGRATLEAHDKRLNDLQDCTDKLNDKMDSNTKLLIGTLVGIALNFAYMVLGR